MKKSECFKMAERAVIHHPVMTADDKLEVLRVLMANEDIAKYAEEKEEGEKDV